MNSAMPQTRQCGQQPVDEDEPALRPGSRSPSPRPSRQACLMLFVPQRSYLSHEFNDHRRRQSRTRYSATINSP